MKDQTANQKNGMQMQIGTIPEVKPITVRAIVFTALNLDTAWNLDSGLKVFDTE